MQYLKVVRKVGPGTLALTLTGTRRRSCLATERRVREPEAAVRRLHRR